MNPAGTVTINPGIGSVANSGSYSVTPAYTTTYTLTATNVDGTVSASTTITVAPPVSPYSSSSGANMIGSSANSGQGSILTLGLGGSDSQVNSRLLYILLIGLLAIAAVWVIVFLLRTTALAPATNRAGARAAYIPYTSTATRAEGSATDTTPATAAAGPKFMAADGEYVSISGSSGTLGRSDFRSLVKPKKADLLSREHIWFECDDGQYYIEDHNSTNGTKVNGSSISGKGRCLLKDGDVVELGNALELTFNS